VYNNELVAGGTFSTAGGSPSLRTAKWNGSAWSPLGGGMNSAVFSLAVYNGELIAGGTFSVAGGLPASHIAKWNGSVWSAFNSHEIDGSSPTVNTIHVYNDILFIGGFFTTINNLAIRNIAKWNGTNWTSSGNMNSAVYCLNTFNSDLIAGGTFTTSSGNSVNFIGKYTTKVIGIQPVSISIPSEFSLKQNYPNPFNPSTVIEFSVPVFSAVKLDIYDLLGRLIDSPVSGDLSPGTYRINWDASGLAGGIYFYVLKSRSEVYSRKMILIK